MQLEALGLCKIEKGQLWAKAKFYKVKGEQSTPEEMDPFPGLDQQQYNQIFPSTC